MNQVLYAKDVSGSIRVWMISAHAGGLTIEYGQLGGALQTKEEDIRVGKGGRTLDQQIYLQYLSRINKQFQKGYLEDLEAVKRARRTNAMGLLRPMKAQPIAKVRDINYGQAFYQHKYDGNRCLVTKCNGVNVAYSSNGKSVDTLSHITNDIVLEEGETIDGELYCHGVPLQTINSWKSHIDTAMNLSLRVYDIIENSPYIDRLERLESLKLGGNAILVPTVRVYDEESLDELLASSLASGYEGGMLRWGDAGYEDGKRSKNIAKIKVFMDDEYEVVDIVNSKDGWAILVCEMPDGKRFSVSAPGSFDKKFEIAMHANEYVNRMVNVKYANLTKAGIPFHPVATMFRDKAAGE